MDPMVGRSLLPFRPSRFLKRPGRYRQTGQHKGTIEEIRRILRLWVFPEGTYDVDGVAFPEMHRDPLLGGSSHLVSGYNHGQ